MSKVEGFRGCEGVIRPLACPFVSSSFACVVGPASDTARRGVVSLAVEPVRCSPSWTAIFEVRSRADRLAVPSALCGNSVEYSN